MSSQDPLAAATLAPPAVRAGEAFRFWLWLGCVSFGGPAGQISIMYEELVERRRWISESRFLHALSYTMVLPGPEAQQLATYIGWLLHGTAGAVVAGVLFVLPSLALLMGLAWAYLSWSDVPLVAGVLYGIKPAITAVVLFAAWRIARRTLHSAALAVIAAAAFAAMFFLHLPFPLIVVAAALAGLAGGRLAPAMFRTGRVHDIARGDSGPAIIDDRTPLPPYARFRLRRTLALLGAGALLWLAVMALLVLRFGREGVLPAMGWFFTKASLVTFGGAYAVLPYVYQGAVEGHHWLSAGQMMDGLALGETTPGPLIMIVAFVGFLGGWAAQVLGSAGEALSGVAGAAVATFFTFLPSFLFIIAGGPLVEGTRHQIRFTAPLAAITAAVVGVVLDLALFFAEHTLWPQGGFDWLAAVITLAAAAALLTRRAGVIPVIGACAIAGAVRALLA